MKIIITSLLLTSCLLASDFSGVGFGKTIKEAKHEALSDLSQNIKSDVQSQFNINKSSSRSSANSTASQDIKVNSNLPIIGAEFKLFDNKKSVEALVTLNQDKAKKVYAAKLNDLFNEIVVMKIKLRLLKTAVNAQYYYNFSSVV